MVCYRFSIVFLPLFIALVHFLTNICVLCLIQARSGPQAAPAELAAPVVVVYGQAEVEAAAAPVVGRLVEERQQQIMHGRVEEEAAAVVGRPAEEEQKQAVDGNKSTLDFHVEIQQGDLT